MKAAAYIRVSTSRQADHGYSLDAQTMKVRAMAMLKGYAVAEIVADDESGKNLNRPGVQRILEMVRQRAVDAVIVMKLDRFTRSVKDLADIMELFNSRNVALLSVTEMVDTRTANGELSLNIATSVSQWERRAIGERTQLALDYKRSQGQRLGNTPFGFQADGKYLKVNPAEQVIVVRINALRDCGASCQEIADILNAEGQSTRRGSAWRREYVYSVLRQRPVVVPLDVRRIA